MVDIAKLFHAGGEFEIRLSMGNVYIRPMTSRRLDRLEAMARSENSTDGALGRLTLAIAGRRGPDPNPREWNADDEYSADDLADAATAADLEALSSKLVEVLSALHKDLLNKGGELSKGADES